MGIANREWKMCGGDLIESASIFQELEGTGEDPTHGG